jgi:hypothetical protein
MTTYLITYTYTGDIVVEIDADSVEDALALAQVEDPGSGYTAIVAGVELDMDRTGNPRVTVKRPRRSQ